MAKLPDGWVFKPKMKDRLTIEIEERELVCCRNCWKRRFDNCPFNEFCGYEPDDDFWCAEGEKKG